MRPVSLIVFLVVLGCGGPKTPPPGIQPSSASPESALPSPPRVARPIPNFDFVAYGDCRWHHDVHRKICASIVKSSPKFVVVTGDLVDWSDSVEDWSTFREITRELRSKTPYYAAPGNHDVPPTDTFLKEFGLEKLYFDRRVGDIHLFFLDSNWGFTDPEQLRWLEETAKASDAIHKFAAFHHPPFTIEPWGDFEERRVRETLHPVLVRLKFCGAFCGHHHVFYTTRRDGIRYVVTAGGGAPLYPLDETRAQKGDLFRKFHHFVGCRVLEKKIAAQVFEPDGYEAEDLAFTLCEHP